MPKCPNGKKNCDCTPEELRQAALRNKNQPKVKAPPKVFKVKDPDPDDRFNDIHPHLPQPPSLLLIVGSVKQGKSNLLVNLLCNPDMYKDKFDIVKIISNTLNADPKGKLMNKYFDCEDHYNDEMITDMIEAQKKFEDFERPTVAMVLDDILTKDFKKTNAVSFLATRFRHYGIGLLAFTTQSFRAVSGLIRNNATDVIIMKQQNNKELEKINEEYGDLFPGIFMELYKKAIEDQPYSFLYLDMQTNPASAYIRFETKIADGEKKLF